MATRYIVFSEDIGGETHWGIYDNDTGDVLEWYATEDEADSHIPKESK